VIGQKWKPKLEQLMDFLVSKGVRGVRIYEEQFGSTLRIFDTASIRSVRQPMLPYAFLKKQQIAASLDYFENRIAGDELMRVSMREYKLGKRRTKPPHATLPYTRTAGIEASRLNALALARKSGSVTPH